MFLVGWEMQYDETSHSYGQLVIDSFLMTKCPLMYPVSSLAEFFGDTSKHQLTQPPYSPDLIPWDF